MQICSGIKTPRYDMRTTHEEADVILVQQAIIIATQVKPTCIKVVSDDTDVFILLLYYYRMTNMTCKLLMEGTSSLRTTANIGATVKRHWNIIPELPAAHAITGCDSVAFIGKATALKVLAKGVKLTSVGDRTATLDGVIKEATSFVGQCYGGKQTDNMSKVRLEMWLNKTGKRKLASPPKLKSIPLTTESFVKNFKKAHYQTIIWKSALQPHPTALDPTDFGWSKDELSKSLLPVTLKPNIAIAPADILQAVRCGCATNQPCNSSRYVCCHAHLSCTAFCKCYQSENCHNKWTKVTNKTVTIVMMKARMLRDSPTIQRVVLKHTI
ncbi:hypothetical protein Pcinc_012368 [Petrolisthes cinctipes]|uniref:Tesmin/TSO1-like CXC domain-containing protein n=1 Tax=Petrolisthes cinctipes TaxID=88211 RepID=A0AAE1FZ46_PETCI|nr:hypothetical protein Pcinc_012368 [Petrolisthes cinctipes]